LIIVPAATIARIGTQRTCVDRRRAVAVTFPGDGGSDARSAVFMPG
jgi:hypothetical protein